MHLVTGAVRFWGQLEFELPSNAHQTCRFAREITLVNSSDISAAMAVPDVEQLQTAVEHCKADILGNIECVFAG